MEPQLPQSTDAPQVDRRDIERLNADWIAAVNTKDIGKLTNMVTDDVVFLPPGFPPIRGRRAVEAMYQKFFPQFSRVEQAATIEEIEIVDGWAYMWGTESLMLVPASGGPAVHLQGKGMTVLKRQADGSWRFARGINNSIPSTTPR